MSKRESQRHFAGEGPVPYPEDVELVRRVRKGDAEAFEPVVRRHADAGFRLSRFLTADSATARRVAVEAFREAFETLYPEEGGGASADDREPAGASADEYAADFRRCILSAFRRLALAEPPIPPPSRAIEATGGSGDPASFRKVRELAIDLREVIVLRHCLPGEELEYEVIGRICGLSVDKVAERLAGARHDLARTVGALSGEKAPGAAGEPTGPGRLATGTGIELYVILSRHVDGKLSAEQTKDVERELKESSGCREELAALRGADRFAARAVESVSDEGLVGAALEELALHSRAVPMGGRRVPRPVLWALVVLAAVSAGAIVAAALHALLGGREEEHRVLEFQVETPDGGRASGGERARRPRWRVRRPGEEVSDEVTPGSRVSTGTVLELPAEGAHGTISRPDGLRLYAEAGAEMLIDHDATDEGGFVLAGGRLLVVLPEGGGPLDLAVGGAARLRIDGAPAQVLVASPERRGTDRAHGRPAVVSVLSGSVGVFGEGGELELRGGQMAALRPGQPAEVASHIDPRTFALDFVPAPLRRSAWPVKGGSAARSGWSPFLLAGPPVQAASLDGVVGASAVVLGGDGTGYFMAGPPPGRLAAVDLGPVRKAVVVASFPSPFAGDPALGPDGRIYACTRDGAVLAFDPGARTEGLVTVVAASSGSIPRTGPTLGRDGTICVVYADGLAAHSGEGKLRWRRNDIAAGAPPSIGPDGTVFAASLGGRLHVLDPATGRDLAGEELSAREAFLSHVAVALDGTAYAVSARGKLLWRSPEGEFGKLALPEADYPLAPAVGGGGEVIVASSGGTVYRMRARPTAPPGAPFFEAGEPVRQGPLVDGAGRVLLLTRSGTLVTVDPTRRSRPAELGARGASPPAITRHGALVIVTRDGRVFAGKGRAGEGR